MADEITCFMAALCRDKAEGGTGHRYFGSLGAYLSHAHDCLAAGLLDASGRLTPKWRAVGEACMSLPDGRAYAYGDQYRAAANAAAANF